MAKVDRNTKRAGLLWPTIGLIFFLCFWLALCTAGAWYLYQYVVVGSQDPNVNLRALQWMTWPYTVLVVAGPIIVLVSISGLRVIRDLLDLRNLVGEFPSQVERMRGAVDEFRSLRSQIITDVSRVNEATSDELSTPELNLRATPAQVRLGALYDRAKEIFYSALEDYNTENAEALIVQRGGHNFKELTEKLSERRAFGKDQRTNSAKAEFLLRVFELEATTRRSRNTISDVQVQELERLIPKL